MGKQKGKGKAKKTKEYNESLKKAKRKVLKRLKGNFFRKTMTLH
jgi:hypothetical protein